MSMKTVCASFEVKTLVLALAAGFGSTVAADEVEALIRPDSAISVGVGSWSKARPQQGIYDGMRESGAYGLFDADIVVRDEATGTWYKLTASNLGLENRELRAEVLQQGRIGGFLEYNKTERVNPMTFNTALQGIGSSNMTVSGAGANALPIRRTELGTKREHLRAGFYKSLTPGLEFKIEFKNEEKSGARPWGFGSQALFLAEPIDATTRQLEASLRYHSGNFQISGGYYGSWYENAHKLVWGLVNGAAQPGTTGNPNPVPLSQALDNQAHQIFVDGGYSFSKTTRGTFKIAYTRATQDETLPSWGLAAPNNRFINAPSSLNGRVDTTLAQFGLTSRPTRDLSLVANLRYYDVNDKTPLRGFVGNNGTGVATGFNTPHSFTTTSGKLEATYRLPLGFSLMGGVDYSNQERSVPKVGTLWVPFRSRVEETTYRVQVRRSLDENLNGTLAFLRSDRRGSNYKVIGDPREDAINPLHIADRTRDKWRLMFDWMPVDLLSLQLTLEDSRDRYDHNAARPYGPLNGRAQLYSLDASYALSDNWQLGAWYSYDTTRARSLSFRQAGNGAANADKYSRLKEAGNAFGANLRGKLSGKLRVSANLDWYQTDSESRQDIVLLGAGALFPTAGGVTVAPLPDIRNQLLRIKLSGTYALEKNADLIVDLVHERWRSDDWTWNFANGTPFIYGTATDGTTVTAKQKQRADFIGVRYVYKWQ